LNHYRRRGDFGNRISSITSECSWRGRYKIDPRFIGPNSSNFGSAPGSPRERTKKEGEEKGERGKNGEWETCSG